MENGIINIRKEEIKKLLQEAATGNPLIAHNFFSHFPFINHYQNEDYLSAFNSGVATLGMLKELDQQAYNNIHKGYIFYFIAISAFFLHDFEAATYFFDAAASEDMKNDPNSLTPALLFMTLDGNNLNQAARKQTVKVVEWLNTIVNEYNKQLGARSLTVSDVRSIFLERAITDNKQWRTLVTSLISFLLELSHRFVILNLRVEDGTWEPFYIHLFKGCLLFESVLKAVPNALITQSTIGSILNSNSFIRSILGIEGSISTKGILADVINDARNAPPSIASTIEITARLRNSLGHNLGWAIPITLADYSRLAIKVSISCLHVISTLYR